MPDRKKKSVTQAGQPSRQGQGGGRPPLTQMEKHFAAAGMGISDEEMDELDGDELGGGEDPEEPDNVVFSESTPFVKFVGCRSPIPTEFLCLLPASNEGLNTRIKVSSDEPFEDFLESVYTSIGCSDVRLKPEVAYKLSNGSKKKADLGTILSVDDDWNDAVEDLRGAQSRQRNKATPIHMIISITDSQVCGIRAS